MAEEQYRIAGEVLDLLKVDGATVRRRVKGKDPRTIDIGKGSRGGSSNLDVFLRSHATRPARAGIA